MTIHDYILGHGFEGTLDALITHAETQAKLHQSLGDRNQWLYQIRLNGRDKFSSHNGDGVMGRVTCLNGFKLRLI